MGVNESRSNGRLAKKVHPHHTLNYKNVIFGLCVLYVVTMGESKSRSNGRLTKDFHPHHRWNHEHVIFRIYIFFYVLCVVILRSQIKLLTCEKAGSYEKAGHVFFIVQLFLDSKFL